jgi:very-short-patch-repair endonuclease
VEVDGPIHEQQADSDAARTAFFEAMGLHVLRFSNQQVLQDSEGVISAIAAYAPGSASSSGSLS